MTAKEKIMQEVLDERKAQDDKWGQQDHPDGTAPGRHLAGRTDWPSFSTLEASLRHYTDERARSGDLTFADILLEEVFEAMVESNETKLREELIQSAAVILAWVEAIDRRRSDRNAGAYE